MQGTDSPEIIELVDKSLIHDRQAQFELYSRYNKAMFNVCIRFIGEHTEAEDILQDAFLEAFKNLANFRRESSFGAWLKRIVVNKSLNVLKKKKLNVASMDDSEYGIQIAEVVSEPEEESRYDMNHVRKAVEALPDGYRTVFSLYAVEGYDHEEISNIMGISVSTSKSQYHRAKSKVRALIQVMEV